MSGTNIYTFLFLPQHVTHCFWFKCRTWHTDKQRIKEHVVGFSSTLASEDGLWGTSV